MDRCSNCKKDYEIPLFPSEDGRYKFCMSCHVSYGKNRTGFAFMTTNEVYLKNYHSKTDGRIFIVKGIFIYDACESGRLVYLVDKESGRPLKQMIDVNWLEYIDNNKIKNNE